MRKTVYKLFWAWNFEKEEIWLNEMSNKGWHLIYVGLGKYVFEKGECGEYIFKMEFLENLPTHYKSADYIQFLAETGVEHIGSLFRWVYFRKKASSGTFEIYSDIDSKIKHYKRIRTLIFVTMSLQIPFIFNNFTIFLKDDIKKSFIVSSLSIFLVIILSFGALKMTKKIKKLIKDKNISD